ncbi:MAG: hypothetical protein KC420_09010 [Myxococcales bacterium]|nr:hypothetical protein [Myxococcales bacterium]MCB9569609.1 hypothetical protein [Myxococcales bacterium]MCB9706507.1 hypothetical protein [Myxococcales bacterium]
MARRPAAPLLALALSAAGCVLTNPEYSVDELATEGTTAIASTSAADTGGDASGGQISTSGVISGGDSDSDGGTSMPGSLTIDGLGPGSASSTSTSTSTTGEGTTTGGGDTTGDAPAFDKMTLRNYNPDTCGEILACTWMGFLVAANHVDIECFTPAVDGPLYVSRVGINVAYRKNTSPLTVDFYAYDPVAKAPTGGVIASAPGPSISKAVYHEVFVDPPVMFAEPAFCAAVRTGDNDSQVAIPIDVKTPGAGLSFLEMEADGSGCDIPRTPVESYFKSGNGHWCVNVDIQPTP